ncbi:glycosyltransferase [Thermus thermophilus]|nr:glycosyltransferase [Thermus thermophilus]BDB11803.1 glycosyl transferase [Thermus thermophilus]
MLITGLARGGAETQLLLLASGLKRRGWQVRVVSMLPPEDFAEELREGGVPVDSLGMTRGVPDPRALWRFSRVLREFRPSVVHAHMIHANLLARLTRLFVRVPVLVCTAHNTIEVGRGFRTESAVHLAYRLTDPLCDLTTQVSLEGYRRYLEGRAAPPKKLRYVPNAVDLERFAPDPALRQEMRKALGLSEEAFLWLAVGRLEEAKDYPTLLQAFALVVKTHPKATLFVVGKGILESSLRDLVRSLGLEASVRFLGLRKDVPALMCAADAYVLSSAWEGMPMVLLEAHASGLPVVSTDVGGVREVVRDGVSGYVVPPRDPSALAEAMKRLQSLPKEKQLSMGVEGRKWVEENYSLETLLGRWEALYKDLYQKKCDLK